MEKIKLLIVIGIIVLPGYSQRAKCSYPERIKEFKEGGRKVVRVTSSGTNMEAYFSPDSKKLLMQARGEDEEDMNLYEIDLTTFKQQKITNLKGTVECSYYSPDGSLIVFSSSVDAPENIKLRAYSIKKSYMYNPGREIYISNRDGSGMRRLTNNSAYEAEVSFSPDGKKILFTSDRDGNLELYTMDLNGENVTRLTNTRTLQEGGAFYSPDGSKIVFRAWYYDTTQEPVLATNARIYIMDADGKNVKALTDENEYAWSPYFSYDGKKIFFASNRDDPKYEIYVMDIDGKNRKRLTFNQGFDSYPTTSPDGKWLCFTSDRDGNLNLYIMDIEDLSGK